MNSSQLKKTAKIVNRFLGSQIKGDPVQLYKAAGYLIVNGGKRLRPLMALLSHNLFSEDVVPVLDPAIGVEVFHNFTLMHDDIMDEAPIRRGNDTYMCTAGSLLL